MTKITTTIDGIHGLIKIAIADKNEKQTIELKWCLFDNEGSTGFLTSLNDDPIAVTELAAEHFVRMIINSLIRTFQLKPGDLTIINHMGDSLPDVQFLPPTFKGNEADITLFVAQQDSLLKLFTAYDQSGALTSDLIIIAEDEGIVDDFLSLVHIRASGICLAIKKPSQ